MMKIGKFQKTANGFTGRILTIELQSDKVSLIWQSDRNVYDVFVGEVNVGTAIRSRTGDDHVDIELDDPSFSAPIRGEITKDDKGSYNLIRKRGQD